jgi:SAM-dependent methyltransferase
MKIQGTNIWRRSADLFVISFLILFLELVCIRWFASTVVFLTFFTNIVLLATFLGMSVGCLAAADRRNLVQMVVPLLLLSFALATGVLYVYNRFGQVMIDVGSQGSPQQIYFGTEYRARDVSRFVVPIEVVAATFFVLTALIFVGLGQTLGRAFGAVPDRVIAYTVNIAGSLAGIAAIAALSYLQTPPEIWFAIAFALCLSVVPRWTPLQVCGQVTALVIIAWSAHAGHAETIWSPYYKIQYSAEQGAISTNNIGHQVMLRIEDAGAGYVLPHLLNRDSGGPPFEQVLVIGAGSGNDVAAALRYGATHVDAVEIDPAIFALGRRDHPNSPYADPRVTVHIDDGRSFLRRARGQYDLIIYALVDSLVLQSGYSTVRLESFLFTREAFADINARLKPNGVFAAYNAYRQGWVVGRLQLMMGEAFGNEPLVMALPYRPQIAPSDPVPNITFLLGGRRTETLARVRQHLSAEPFWLNDRPAINEPLTGFSSDAPALAGVTPSSWHRVSLSRVDVRPNERIPIDDWPFLYLRDPVVPALNLRGIAIMAVLSLALLWAFAPKRGARPNWRMFFMGAGFMLVETKSVVHLALLFGSTWMVNSVVVFAILVMILCSNLFVLAVRPHRMWPYYALLALALAAGIVVPMSMFLNLPEGQRVLASCTVVFLPIFFAGIVFATAFRESRTPDIDFGSNIAGAVLGGLCESLSLVIGFNHLLIVALLFYGLSAVLGPRRTASVPSVSTT